MLQDLFMDDLLEDLYKTKVTLKKYYRMNWQNEHWETTRVLWYLLKGSEIAQGWNNSELLIHAYNPLFSTVLALEGWRMKNVVPM